MQTPMQTPMKRLSPGLLISGEASEKQSRLIFRGRMHILSSSDLILNKLFKMNVNS